MKVFKNVRGSMKNIPSIEVNRDTVYIRSNIKRVEDEDFKGWEYDEIQYDKDNYIEVISEENEMLKAMVTANTNTVDFQEDVLQEVIFNIYDLQGGE